MDKNISFPSENNPKDPPLADNQDDLLVGLKTLVHSKDKLHPPSILHCYTLATTSFFLPSSSFSMTRRYPPSMPLLAQTSKMPWNFKREYEKDGRLIIRAERARHHEYLETHRENGRLIMMLVRVDLNTMYYEEEEEEEEEEGKEVEELESKEQECGWFDAKEELAREDSNLWQIETAVPCGVYMSGLINTYGGGLDWNLGQFSKGNEIEAANS